MLLNDERQKPNIPLERADGVPSKVKQAKVIILSDLDSASTTEAFLFHLPSTVLIGISAKVSITVFTCHLTSRVTTPRGTKKCAVFPKSQLRESGCKTAKESQDKGSSDVDATIFVTSPTPPVGFVSAKPADGSSDAIIVNPSTFRGSSSYLNFIYTAAFPSRLT